MLDINNLAVVAGGITLVRGFSVHLRPGELVALAGPSGSGKTTLLRTIAGLVDPAEGQILLDDRTPEQHEWPCFRRRVILLQQRPTVFEGSVEDNLKRPFRYRSAGKAYSRDDAVRLLETFLIEPERLTQEARSLSEGQQQRICLVRALLLEPDVLLLDEPPAPSMHLPSRPSSHSFARR